jgi:hypothetical protein
MEDNNIDGVEKEAGISIKFPEIQRVRMDDLETLFEAFISEIKELNKGTGDNSDKFVNALNAVKDELIGTRKNFPETISINEAGDIVEVLKKILIEAKKEKLGEFKNIVKSLNAISKQIPVMPDLPMEDGRIKVILPADQVAGVQVKTETGRRIKQSAGQFIGGMTINPNITLKDKAGNQVNPAKEDGNLSYLAPADEVGDGTVTISVAGTAEQLSTTSKPCRRVCVTAHESNNGTVVVGNSTVVAALAGRRGRALFPTQSEWFYVANVNLLYADATQNNDKLHYFFET